MPAKHNYSITCPYCNSNNTKKEGKRKNKLQIIQKYSCKDCNKNFADKKLAQKSYPHYIILNAISSYNLGNTQQQTSNIIKRKYKIEVPQRTISEWINQYNKICTFSKIRQEAIKLYPPKEIIFQQTLNHIQPYTFKYHKAKLHLLFNNIKYNNQFHNTNSFYEPLKQYLEKIPTDKFPHHIFNYHQSSPNAEIARKDIFNNAKINNNAISVAESASEKENRASQIKFSHLNVKIIKKHNQANQLAQLAINLAISNKDRHNSIQNFMLINDSTTIATEIPIYLTNWDVGYYRNQKGLIFPLSNYKTPITGHIDLLQIRNGLIHILDYKPEADKIKPIEQLTVYALALSRKLNLPLYYFKCAWFDENNYYEFFPLHAVYQKRKV